MGKVTYKTIEGKHYAITYLDGMVAVFAESEISKAYRKAEMLNVI